MSGEKRLRVACPDCGSELVVDARTGRILAHEKAARPLAGGATLEELFEGMEAGRNRAEEVFEQEKAAVDDQDRLLEEKFREAMSRAEDDSDEEPPLRPFDLD